LQFSFNISKNLQHCASCYKDKPLFRQLVTVFKYTPEIKSIILNFKYNDKTQLAKPFGKLISEKLKSLENPKFDFITPVPLHSKKLRQRMYNQAALIAQNLSITFVADLLIREKDNSSQTNYTRIMRLKNIRGAFVINKKYKDLIKDKNILLIDDVITTGATINECCKILQKHHCSSITAATIAKRVLYS
jgi:ComF family protein